MFSGVNGTSLVILIKYIEGGHRVLVQYNLGVEVHVPTELGPLFPVPVGGGGSNSREFLGDTACRRNEDISETIILGGFHIRYGSLSGCVGYRKAMSWISVSPTDQYSKLFIPLSAPIYFFWWGA